MRLANGKEEIFKLMVSLFPSDGSASGDCFNLDFFKQLQGVISVAIFLSAHSQAFRVTKSLPSWTRLKIRNWTLKLRMNWSMRPGGEGMMCVFAQSLRSIRLLFVIAAQDILRVGFARNLGFQAKMVHVTRVPMPVRISGRYGLNYHGSSWSVS